jgi:23S rRNA G2069 N7-methylase RlmK/C1962 C5-methylase RlmI
VAVDSSEDVIDIMMSNLKFNIDRMVDCDIKHEVIERNDDISSLSNVQNRKRVTLVKADVGELLKKIHQTNEKAGEDASLFDVVICDPPKLAPKKTFLKKAMKR